MPLADVDQIVDVQTSIGRLLQPHGVTQHQRQSLAALLGPDGVGVKLNNGQKEKTSHLASNTETRHLCGKVTHASKTIG